MNIIVCIKQVPEAAEAELELTDDGGDIEREDLVMAIGEWDNYAVEEAVRLKEAHGGTVTVVTVGDEDAEDVLRRALAMGADAAVLVDEEDFVGSDAVGIARGLRAAIGDRPVDLVLAGAQSADTGWGQVGGTLAELLGLAHAALAVSIEVADGALVVQRELESNTLETVRLPLPALVTVQTGINTPRYVSVMGIRKVRRIAIEETDADELELDEDMIGPMGSRVAARRLTLPPKGGEAEILEGSLDTICARAADIIRDRMGVAVMGGILVLAEHRQGALRDVTFELVAAGRRLADDVAVVVLGDEVGPLAAVLGRAADRVLTMSAPELGEYNVDTWLPALAAVIAAERPRLTLVGHTACGMELAPALAVRAGLPLVTDCLELRFDGEALAVERQVFGGKIHEHLTLKPAAAGYLATVRPGGAAAEPDPGRAATHEALAVPDLAAARRGRELVGFVEAALEDVNIADADVLVAVGRGVGKPENLAPIEALAQTLGATLACSRPVADKGWLPKSRQVGTSGQAVRPKVYLALGISGAYQHVAGMRNAATIIAVNSDPAAPIFDVAHYGIVADMFEVLPLLTERLTRG